jgi:hypothetical protein
VEGGVQLGPLGTAVTNGLLCQARDYDDGEIGEMIGRGNPSTRRKPTPVPLCPPQTPHAARTRTRAAEVGSQRLTALAKARPLYYALLILYPSNSRDWRVLDYGVKFKICLGVPC